MRGLLMLAGLGLVAVCRASIEPEVLVDEEAEVLVDEEPQKQEVDNDVCVPLKCEEGTPPAQCTRLCAIRQWLPHCQNASQNCVCKGPGGEVMSPDEMEKQEEPFTYTIFTIFFPDYFWSDQDASPTPDTEMFEAVNVHEGRLLWDFRYVLGGLLLLMLGLVAYELVLCRRQNAKAKFQMDPFDLYGVEKPLDKKEPMVI